MFQFSGDYKSDGLGVFSKALGYDKWVHLTGSFFFTCLLSLWLPIVTAAFVVFVAGIVLEIWQGFRDLWGFSFIDLVANLIGCISAYAFVAFALIRAFM